MGVCDRIGAHGWVATGHKLNETQNGRLLAASEDLENLELWGFVPSAPKVLVNDVRSLDNGLLLYGIR